MAKRARTGSMRTIVIVVLLLFLAIGTVLAAKQLTQSSSSINLPLNPFVRSSPLTNSSSLPMSSEGQRVGPSPDFNLQTPAGFELGVFARDLGSPRDVVFSPGGTLLVSIPKRNQVVALPDTDQDGVADETVIVAQNLNNPHGITFYQNKLFIIEETQAVRYSWNEENLTASQEKKILFQLPPGGNHTTRTVAFNSQGEMFISIGSTCNVCYENHSWLAAVITSDSEGNNPRLFAKGLRNAPFITVNPLTDQLWGTEMGRDYLGDNAPPDEINIIQSNRDYGWPLCWGNKIHDTDFDKNQYIRDPCANTEAPLYGIAAHSAPLGLTFIQSDQFPQEMQNDLLVAYHGSWNRSSRIGYKVVHLQLNGNNVVKEEDFLTGFLVRQQVLGRPVDLAFDPFGSLFVSDDATGMIYKIIGQ
ncbi:sorbosone dehydrogenase family protein [Candidatus Microgenomates bacterium]|nr:MAG: sorbosone dehydrogenase family protein [Candidatus Microgenomates bacterium]